MLERSLSDRKQAFLVDLQLFAHEFKRLRDEQYRVDTATERLESRMINVISFSITLEMFRRFLNHRAAEANLILAEPIDDITPLQERVDLAEATLRAMPDKPSHVNDETANSN
jgi:hypothetical protein